MNSDFIIDVVTALWLGLIGACIGSFLNVVAYRLPRGLSVVWKPSHCPRCGHAIRPYDNIPVLGWLRLRGKCRDCGERIAPRYAIVEGILGGVFFLLAFAELFSAGANIPGGPFSESTTALDVVWRPQWPLIGLYCYHCAMVTLLLTIALLDRDGERIPRRLLLFATLIGILPPLVFGAPPLFPPSASIGTYVLHLTCHVVISILLSVAIGAATNLPAEKVYNLAAALSLVGLFLGASVAYRAAYLGLFLVTLVVAAAISMFELRAKATQVDSVWLAVVIQLAAPFIAQTISRFV